jgi:hypothetical protein
MTATSQTSGVSIVLPLYAALFLSACMAGGGTGSVNDTPPARENEDSAGGSQPPVTMPTYYAWMSPEIKEAWSQGYTGQGTTTIVVDDFTEDNRIAGKLSGNKKMQRHGEWVVEQIGLLAPDSVGIQYDYVRDRNSAIPCRPASSTRSI